MVSTGSEMGSYRRMELLRELTQGTFLDRNTTCAERNELLGKGLIVPHPLSHTMSDAYDIPSNAPVNNPPPMKAYILTDEGRRELQQLLLEWRQSP